MVFLPSCPRFDLSSSRNKGRGLNAFLKRVLDPRRPTGRERNGRDVGRMVAGSPFLHRPFGRSIEGLHMHVLSFDLLAEHGQIPVVIGTGRF